MMADTAAVDDDTGGDALSPPPEEASMSMSSMLPLGGGSSSGENALDAANPVLVAKLGGYVGSAGARLLLDAEAPDQALAETLRSPGAQAALARFVADARAPVLYLDSYVPTGALGLGWVGVGWRGSLCVDRWWRGLALDFLPRFLFSFFFNLVSS